MLVPDTRAFLSPTPVNGVSTLLGDCTKVTTAAALFCGWGAEVHLLLEKDVGRVYAVDQLEGLLQLMLQDMPPAHQHRVDCYTLDALAFLLLAPARLDLVTALGGGPSYVGQGALLASVREKLRPGGFALIGDLIATGDDRRREASDLFGVQLPYLLTEKSYDQLIRHAGFQVDGKLHSTTRDWADYFTRMEDHTGLNTFPFNNEEFGGQLAKEKARMLAPAPPAAYVTWRLSRR